MSRIIRVIIQKSSYRNITEKGLTIVNPFSVMFIVNPFSITEKGLTIVNPFSVMFRYEDFWIITLIILLIVYILGESKHLITKVLVEKKFYPILKALYSRIKHDYKMYQKYKMQTYEPTSNRRYIPIGGITYIYLTYMNIIIYIGIAKEYFEKFW